MGRRAASKRSAAVETCPPYVDERSDARQWAADLKTRACEQHVSVEHRLDVFCGVGDHSDRDIAVHIRSCSDEHCFGARNGAFRARFPLWSLTGSRVLHGDWSMERRNCKCG